MIQTKKKPRNPEYALYSLGLKKEAKKITREDIQLKV